MGFEEAQSYLDGLGVDLMRSRPPSLHRIQALCDALDNPERKVPAMHVTGTNGKTSTVRVAASLLDATGLSVAAYTSPHLETVRERISFSGEPVGEDVFGDIFDHISPYLAIVEDRLEEKLSYFEVLTAMFFLSAAEGAADAMVVEVGLGGRWDATNVVPATVSVVTNIGLDHIELLGSTRASIAREKAGIAKADSVFVIGEPAPDVVAVLAAEADAAGATTSVIEKDFAVTTNQLAFGGRYLSARTTARDYEGLFLPLHGRHQGVNAAIALEAATRFVPGKTLDQEVVADGFAAAVVPGRVEPVRSLGDGAPPVVLDVAHNPAGMSALVTTVAEAFAFERAHFVIGVLADKDYRGMLSEIARVPCSLVFTRPPSARSVALEELQQAARKMGLECRAIEDVAGAVDAAVSTAGAGDLVCVTGSHYVVGEARSHLMRH